MPTQDERSTATRGLIVEAATREFASVGYKPTSMNSIAEAAGVSKGALYHHFPTKQSIMAAVYEDAERRLVDRLARAAGEEARPLEAIRKGSHEFLRACLDPDLRTLLLVEAPAALGWEQWRAIDSQFGLGLLQAGVGAAVEAGELPRLDPDGMARLLLAALMEAALVIGHAAVPKRELERVLPVMDALIDGLACARTPAR